MAGERGALASWVTGWFNLLGQVAITAGIEYSLVRAAPQGTSGDHFIDYFLMQVEALYQNMIAIALGSLENTTLRLPYLRSTKIRA